MRFYGKVGYQIESEAEDSVWVATMVAKPYFGDVIRNNSRRDTGDVINDTININNRISIVADPFAFENFQNMKYVEWLKQLWCVKSAELQPPRIILEIGGVYNGEVAT